MLEEKDIKHVVDSLTDEEILRFSGKTVLLVGSSGFLGGWFYDCLHDLNANKLDNPCRIISMDNNSPWSEQTTSYRTHNITDPLSDLSLGKVDFIINCAGIASPEKYQQLPLETMDVSYLGTKNVLELARESGTESILLFSSSEVYGTPIAEAIPTSEDYVGCIPTRGNRSCYDIGKQLLETLAYIYFNKHNSPVKTVRPFNLYGPYMGTNDNRVLSNFMNNFIDGEPFKIYGDGKQTRTFCYAADGIAFFLKILLNGENGNVYNVGNPDPEVDMHELTKIFYDSFNKPYYYEVIDYPDSYPSDEPIRRCPDISKAQKTTGFTPSIDFKEGLKRMHEYYLSSRK